MEHFDNTIKLELNFVSLGNFSKNNNNNNNNNNNEHFKNIYTNIPPLLQIYDF